MNAMLYSINDIFHSCPHRALVVCAVGLGLPEEGEEPPHGHLMVEDAFTRIEAAVRHF